MVQSTTDAKIHFSNSLHELFSLSTNILCKGPLYCLGQIKERQSTTVKPWIENILQEKQTFLINFYLIYKRCLDKQAKKNSPSRDMASFGAPPAPAQPILRDQPMHVHSEVTLLQSMELTPM